jgi:hypothetical protein
MYWYRLQTKWDYKTKLGTLKSKDDFGEGGGVLQREPSLPPSAGHLTVASVYTTTPCHIRGSGGSLTGYYVKTCTDSGTAGQPDSRTAVTGAQGRACLPLNLQLNDRNTPSGLEQRYRPTLAFGRSSDRFSNGTPAIQTFLLVIVNCSRKIPG